MTLDIGQLTGLLASSCAGFLAAVFAVAGSMKVRSYAALEGFIDATFPNTAWQAKRFSRLLPWIELLCAAMLILPETRPAGGLAVVALLVAFSAFVAIGLAKGVTRGCGCFGSNSSRPLSATTLMRNICLLVLAVPVISEGHHLPATWIPATLLGLIVGATFVLGELFIETAELLRANRVTERTR